MWDKVKNYVKNAYSEITFFIAFKILTIGLLSFVSTYFFIGTIASICSIVAGVGLFLFNFKGFSRRRVTHRSIYFVLNLLLAVFLPFVAKDNAVALVFITFFFIGTVAFFSLEEHIGGFLAHVPIAFVYVYSFYNRDFHSFVLGSCGVIVGALLSYILLQVLWRAKPEEKMKNALEAYLDALISEVHKNRSKINAKEKYAKFLDEFYKTSYGSYLSDTFGKKCFDFTLCLHQLIENYREKKRKKTISKEAILELEIFLLQIKNNEEINTDNLKMPENIMAILAKKRKNLYSKEKTKKDIYKTSGNALGLFRTGLSMNSVRMRHGVKIGLIMSISVYIYIYHGMTQGVWLPMFAMLMAVPYGSKSNKRIFERVLGTIFGLLAVSLVLDFTLSLETRIIASAILFYLAFSCIRYSYAVLSFFVTIAAVLLTTTYLTPENALLERLMYTLLAAVIVYAMEFLLRDRSDITIKTRAIQMLENDLIFVNKMMSFYQYKGVGHLDDCMVKCFLYREALGNDLEKKEKFDVTENLKDSMLFLDKIMLIYAKIKNHDMDKESIQELSVVSHYLKRYILFIKTKKIKYLQESDKQIDTKLEGDTIKDEAVVDIFKLIKYCIEDIESKKYLI